MIVICSEFYPIDPYQPCGWFGWIIMVDLVIYFHCNTFHQYQSVSARYLSQGSVSSNHRLLWLPWHICDTASGDLHNLPHRSPWFLKPDIFWGKTGTHSLIFPIFERTGTRLKMRSQLKNRNIFSLSKPLSVLRMRWSSTCSRHCHGRGQGPVTWHFR